jgi:hypothetical protein
MDTPAQNPNETKSFLAPCGALLALLLLVPLIIFKGYPLNLYLLGALIALVVFSQEWFTKFRWAKAVVEPLKTISIALLLLTLFASAINFLKPEDATEIVNWEDRMVLWLHKWLKDHPTWWQYALLLVAATAVSWKFPRVKAVARVSKAKSWLGTAASVAAVMASVSFLGEQVWVKGQYQEVSDRLQVHWKSLREKKMDTMKRCLAEKEIAESIAQADEPTRTALRNYLGAVTALRLPSGYGEELGRKLVEERQPDVETIADIAELMSPKEIVKSLPPVEQLPDAIEKEEKAGQEAKRDENDARDGLKKVVGLLLNTASDSVFDKAMEVFKPLIESRMGDLGEKLDPMIEKVTDKLKDHLDEYEKAQVERLDKAGPWNGVPKGSSDEVSRLVQKQAADIATVKQRNARATLDRTIENSKADDPNMGDLKNELADARKDLQDANQVLGQGPASTASAGETPARFTPEDEKRLRNTEEAVHVAEHRVQIHEEAVRRAEHPVER